MTLMLLSLCLTLLVYAVVTLVVAAGVVIALPRVITRTRLASSAARARAYLTLRLLPAVTGAIVAFTLFLPSFIAGEPADSAETLGARLWVPAVGVATILALAARRALRAWRETARLRKAWLADASPLADLSGAGVPAFAVSTRFPLVAVVGVWRPVLVVSRRVLESCSRTELDAILSHEAAHLAARDNVTRLVLLLLPDALSMTAPGRWLERAWAEAAEEAADEAAGSSVALPLAFALVRVARMAAGAAPPPATVAALSHGGCVARRVERLLAVEGGAVRPDPGVQSRMLATVVVAWLCVAISPAARRAIHTFAEMVVTWLQ